MLKFLFLLFIGLLVIPRLFAALIPGRSRSRRSTESARPGPSPDGKKDPEKLRDLTRQDISDADYEEIPPEE